MESYEGWAIVEIMGHRRLAGWVQEVEMYGGKLLRIDCYETGTPTPIRTQFYGAASVFCLTPTTEETAKRIGTIRPPDPVSLWELPSPQRSLTAGITDEDPDDEIPI